MKVAFQWRLSGVVEADALAFEFSSNVLGQGVPFPKTLRNQVVGNMGKQKAAQAIATTKFSCSFLGMQRPWTGDRGVPAAFEPDASKWQELREWERANLKENARLCEFLAKLPLEDKEFMGKILAHCFGEDASSKPKEYRLMRQLLANMFAKHPVWQRPALFIQMCEGSRELLLMRTVWRQFCDNPDTAHAMIPPPCL